MKQLKKLVMFSVLVFALATCVAQTENKDVTITASGSGATQEAAKQSALRSAIEQAYGAFISTKTEMLNDQVVADEMASVSAGNIKSYEILNEAQRPDGRWGVTLKATVSIDKLTSFVEAKGISIEVKGGMFALNIKQQLLNEQGEINAIMDMIGLIHEPMQTAFDYTMKSSEPKSLDAESKNWEIPLLVTATCNKNIDFCANYFKKTIAALSLSPSEVETYKSLNKQVFPLSLKYQNQTLTYNLRKQSSISAIESLMSNWEFYTRLFAVQSGKNESYVNVEGNIHLFSVGARYYVNCGDGKYYMNDNRKGVSLNFPSSGNIAATFSWNDKRTLSQIEQMTGYSVKPRGVVSNFKNGGYIVYEKNGHGLVVSLSDIGVFNWNDAKIACADLVLNGYKDWRLPSSKELEYIKNNVFKVGVLAGFSADLYWSSTEYQRSSAWTLCFCCNSRALEIYKDWSHPVRAVRYF